MPYREELTGPRIVTTRAAHDGRAAGRVPGDDLRQLLDPEPTTAYVCGSAGFAESAGELLVDLGVPADAVRVERFGPTGGPA